MFQKRGKVFIIIILIIVLAAIIYLTFFHYSKCKNVACWEAKLLKCEKAKYINDPRDITWLYTINGKKEDRCSVSVEVIKIKNGLKNTEVFESKEMTCLLPFGTIVKPESNPNLCYGRLKEEMQVLIIEKLHQYIVSNIGSISKELTQIEGVTAAQTTQAVNVTNSG